MARDDLAKFGHKLLDHMQESVLNKMFNDVLNAASKICPSVKTEMRQRQRAELKVLWPLDKKSAECLVKAIDRLLPQAKGLEPSMLAWYKKDLKDEFKI